MKTIRLLPLIFYILAVLFLTQACSVSDVVSSKRPALAVAKKTENRADSGISQLSNVQKEKLKALFSEIPVAISAFQSEKNSDEIAKKCEKVTTDADELVATMPPGIFRNTLQQGRDALQLAYLFRFEKEQGIKISPELRKKVIDTYKIGNLEPEKQADRIFNFAQAHFDIAARIASDAGIIPQN